MMRPMMKLLLAVCYFDRRNDFESKQTSLVISLYVFTYTPSILRTNASSFPLKYNIMNEFKE